MKTCKDCSVELSLSNNWTESAQKNRSYLCRACVSARGVAHYKKNQEKYAVLQRERHAAPETAKAVAEYKSAYYAKNRDKWAEYQRRSRNKTRSSPWHRSGALITWVRSRAARRNWEFDLTREWAEQKLDAGICEATGIPFEYSNLDDHRLMPFMPSIDRIDSSNGYTKENCRMVVWIYNMAKAEWSDDAVLRMAKALVNK